MAEYSIPFRIEFPTEYPSDPLVFNPGYPNEGLYLTEVDGFDGSSIRNPVDNIPQRDGAIVHRFLRGARYFTLQGQILANTPTARTVLEEKLRGHTDSMLKETRRLFFTPSGQSERFTEVRLNEPVAITGTMLKTFTLSFVAADPAIYTGTETVTDINPGVSGGAYGSPHTLTNLGNTAGWPVIQILGPAVSFRVRNSAFTPAKVIKFSGDLGIATYSAGPPETGLLELNNFVETAFMNRDGANMMGYYEPAYTYPAYPTDPTEIGEFFPLLPGANVIDFSATYSGGTPKCRIKWNHSWV